MPLVKADIKTGIVYRGARRPDRFVIHTYEKYNQKYPFGARFIAQVEYIPVKFHPHDVSVTFVGKARTVQMDNFLRWVRKALT